MPSPDNLGTAKAFLDAIGRGAVDESLLAPDFRPWSVFSGSVTRDQFVTNVKGLMSVIPKGLSYRYGEATVQGERVALEASAEAELIDGSHYRNVYHFLFVIRAGKVSVFREYMDSLGLAQMLGPVVPRIREVMARRGLKPST